MMLWSLAGSLVLTSIALLLLYTRSWRVTPAAQEVGRHLGLNGRSSVLLLIGSGNGVVLTWPGWTDLQALAAWGVGAAALSLVMVLAWFGWSAWRAEGRNADHS
ncbi:hypothetical protein [Deinococcus multiflagellatus]|uniref:Uncharacterized protein n=1 Tax=Deinococcus multiflagellatus TaxID=1656887 RepID=A0ABW1ZQQ0_9DEIO|nr:hypothetical protein [Deinococcus multiflagellatus]MBZ9714905.1 hypothetical protein [Deinococcus multiflagellatus]